MTDTRLLTTVGALGSSDGKQQALRGTKSDQGHDDAHALLDSAKIFLSVKQ